MNKLIALIAMTALSGWACAADLIIAKNAWVRAPAPGADITAAYMTLEVRKPLTLESASSSAAKAVEVHSMAIKNGVMEMRQLDTLDLKPERPTRFKPGGLHFMLIDLTQPLKIGDSVKILLKLRKGKIPAGTQTLTLPVKATP